MSRFFVGQRVKRIRIDSRYWVDSPAPVGSVGVISSVGPFKAGEDSHDGMAFPEDCDVTVRYDFDGSDRYAQSWELEPILPSGQVTVTLEQLLSVPGLESLENIFAAKA